MMMVENFTHQLKCIISENYEIGALVKFEQIHLGTVNKSFIIRIAGEISTKAYFLRIYNPIKTKDDIEFEHSVIMHLKKKHFALVAGLIHTKDGKTYVDRSKGQDNCYAIFDILLGEDRYSWIDPDCLKDDLKDAGRVLANFHNIVFDLESEQKRCEPKIMDLLPRIAQKVSSCAQNGGQAPFDICLLKNLDTILANIDKTLNVFACGVQGSEYRDLLQMVIHCDYHPGNMKFQNNTITGLFDFDWSKVDVRCFDVALAITYFCTFWEGNVDGTPDMEKASIFYQNYQKAFTTDPGPLNGPELKYLPHMIRAANIYVINWIIQDFYNKEMSIDPYIHIKYLQHHSRFLTWLEKKHNFNDLEELFV